MRSGIFGIPILDDAMDRYSKFMNRHFTVSEGCALNAILFALLAAWIYPDAAEVSLLSASLFFASLYGFAVVSLYLAVGSGMSVGTKSLLFGVHQFIWHPITVTLAWHELYRSWPNWKEMVCIVIHDWGYWGSPNMDGKEGEDHPKRAAEIAYSLLDANEKNKFDLSPWSWIYHDLCLYHSRHYAMRHDTEPSKLCWADKLSIRYDPWWFYLTRAWLTGELHEYRALHASMGENFKTHKEWYDWASERAIRLGRQMSSEGISFHPSPGESKEER